MATSWKLRSIPPHDFFICLDVNEYFDHEHTPEDIYEKGFVRPVPAGDHDILVTIFFNGDVSDPIFTIETAEHLSESEKETANRALTRILGTELDLNPLYEQAGNDSLLQPLFQEFYGLKRISRANLFEDSVNRIIQTQIQHKPTARKMVYDVREAYGKLLLGPGGKHVPAWPRPMELAAADPVQMKKYGLSLRKGEYISGLANEFISGNLDLDELEQNSPNDFYNIMTNIRGIGPTTAQDLMLNRSRTDADFPSNRQGDEEKGLRRWIIYSYGGNPNQVSEEEFQQMIRNWKGYEASALEFLFVNYIINEKKKSYRKN